MNAAGEPEAVDADAGLHLDVVAAERSASRTGALAGHHDEVVALLARAVIVAGEIAECFLSTPGKLAMDKDWRRPMRDRMQVRRWS